MMCGRSLTLISLILADCAIAHGANLKTELEKDSQTTGLALVSVVGQKTVLMPFDKEPKYYSTRYSGGIPTTSKSGRVIAWNVRTMFREPQVVVERVKGEQLTRKAFWLDVSLLSVNENCNRIALLVRSGKENPGAFDLRWTSLDLSADGFIDRLLGTESHGADWSPDCGALVYGKGDEIYMFDTKNHAPVQVGRGYDPAWSPDGKAIAFRGVVGTVSFMNPKGQILRSPLESHAALSSIRWSPHGKYLSFIEKIDQRRLEPFSATTRLVVCRVQDGGCLTAREFGSIRGYYEFQWILGYENFCRDCERAAPFN